MVRRMAAELRRTKRPAPGAVAILAALPAPVLAVGDDGRLSYANPAAEEFFAAGAMALSGRRLDELVPGDSPLLALVDKARATGIGVSEHGVTLEAPRIGSRTVTIDVAPIVEAPGCVTVALHERAITRMIDQRLSHRSAARSMSAMAAMLAHEVKNPLSGIRGAAQLLESAVASSEMPLARLIRDEADRIVALVNQVEMFSDQRPIQHSPVNIHEVLERVRRLAENGFARECRLVDAYDPSLPPVYGNRDLLIQLFLNLVKNAAEAVSPPDGTIVLSTRFQQGLRVTAAGSGARHHLPLVVTVQDNGGGIPEELRPHLFEPFVGHKAGGKGLGLALVAKIVDEHGGVIEFTSEPRRTLFSVMLPMAQAGGGGA